MEAQDPSQASGTKGTLRGDRNGRAAQVTEWGLLVTGNLSPASRAPPTAVPYSDAPNPTSSQRRGSSWTSCCR